MSFKWTLLLAILVRFSCFYVWKHQYFSGETILCWCHWDDFCSRRQRCKMSKVLDNRYILDQMPVFSRCLWFYTTQGSRKCLNSRLLTLIKWAEWASFPGDFTAGRLRSEASTVPLRDGEEGWGLAWVKGTERSRACAPEGSATLPGWSVPILLLSWGDSSKRFLGFRVPSSDIICALFYLPLPRKSLVR